MFKFMIKFSNLNNIRSATAGPGATCVTLFTAQSHRHFRQHFYVARAHKSSRYLLEDHTRAYCQ